MPDADIFSVQLDPKTLAQRLQAERRARGQTQNDVAALLGVARTTIVAVEKGERALSSTEIVRLSEKWGTSVSHLVRPRPVSEPLAPQLRAAAPSQTLKEAEINGVWESAETLRILGENYLELETLMGRPLTQNYPALYNTGMMPPLEAAADIAYRERQRLGLGDGPLLGLRSILENEISLRIFLIQMPSRVAGMFAYDNQLGGCIALNIAHPTERRSWTLAHELFHFLCERYQADVCPLPGAAPRRASQSEKMADTFAGHFLMPTNGLRRRFYDIKASKSDGKVTTGDLLHLKRQFGVSFAALTLRLEELKLIGEGTWKMLQDAKFAVREAEALVGLEPLRDREEALPERMRVLAAEALIRGEVSEGRLSELLMCKRIEVRRIVDEISNEHGISDDGQSEWLGIPLEQSLENII